KWKISPMDIESRARWTDYSRAKDQMFLHTDLPNSPWWVIEADDKRRARLNCIAHLLDQIPYSRTEIPEITLPPLQPDQGYVRPAMDTQRIVGDQFSKPKDP
ncbi:MAG: polyphosphate kinase 2, partial [Rhodothermaceae bacterium]|nr:polyphosphate kinase 2 [Rhodothermaceae bacterium]MYI84852.1 polyphosphate kinase 2 [Rhodothermaceae bacterium]